MTTPRGEDVTHEIEIDPEIRAWYYAIRAVIAERDRGSGEGIRWERRLPPVMR